MPEDEELAHGRAGIETCIVASRTVIFTSSILRCLRFPPHLDSSVEPKSKALHIPRKNPLDHLSTIALKEP